MARPQSEVSPLGKWAAGGVLSSRHVLWLVLAAFIIGLFLYGPALGGGFVFDDEGLPFRRGFQDEPIASWLLGVRPILMFTYWLNSAASGNDPRGYHLLNLLIHAVNTGLVFAVLFRLLSLAGWDLARRRIAAVGGAAIFLVHPLATESVSYIAGRSESLAAMFMLLAWVVFLNASGQPISWRRSTVVVALFGLAVAAKENAVALVGVLLLTDVFWPKPFSLERLRQNRRLHFLIAPGFAAGLAWVARVLADAGSAGFKVQGVAWYQYAFTQSRAIFKYLQLAALPFGQSLDHDFPVSRTLAEHGALWCLLALAAITAAAIAFRRRYPLACFGWLLFLVLLAPTSSVVPIADPLVERRMYLPLFALLLVACEAVRRRWSESTAAIVAVVAFAFAVLCYHHNQLWAHPDRLWARAALESKQKGRPYWHLAETLIAENRCSEAVPYLARGERLMPADYSIQVAWGKTLECMGRPEDALHRLERAAVIRPDSRVYQWIGLLEGEMGRKDAAGLALQQAVRLNPRDSSAHSALGLWYESLGNAPCALREYRAALTSDPHNNEALGGLGRLEILGTASAPGGQ